MSMRRYFPTVSPIWRSDPALALWPISELRKSSTKRRICFQRDSSAISPETMVGLTKGLVEALVYIQDPSRKREVMEVLKKISA